MHLPPHETWGSCPLACWFILSTANHCSIIRQMGTIIWWAETSCNITSQLVFPVQGLWTSISSVRDSWTFSFPQLNNMSCSPMGRMPLYHEIPCDRLQLRSRFYVSALNNRSIQWDGAAQNLYKLPQEFDIFTTDPSAWSPPTYSLHSLNPATLIASSNSSTYISS